MPGLLQTPSGNLRSTLTLALKIADRQSRLHPQWQHYFWVNSVQNDVDAKCTRFLSWRYSGDRSIHWLGHAACLTRQYDAADVRHSARSNDSRADERDSLDFETSADCPSVMQVMEVGLCVHGRDDR